MLDKCKNIFKGHEGKRSSYLEEYFMIFRTRWIDQQRTGFILKNWQKIKGPMNYRKRKSRWDGEERALEYGVI